MPLQDTIFKVEGQKQLAGTLQPQGSKNEALQIISTVLLTCLNNFLFFLQLQITHN